MPSRARWNDEELRAAVACSTSYQKVMLALGLRPHGGNHYRVRRRIEELGLDTSHFLGIKGDTSRSWTDAQLREAVVGTSNIADLLSALGLQRTSAAEAKVRRQIRILRIDTSHFTRSNSRPLRTTAWSDQQLRDAVTSSQTIAQVLTKLGLVPAGGNYDHIKRRIALLELDTTHFTGVAWRRGATRPVRPSLPLREILKKGRWTGSHQLKERLFREGLKSAACELCGWATPRPSDGRIPVELDHINGDKTDNRLENLRVVCPNCHALQPTHRALNRGSRRIRTDT